MGCVADRLPPLRLMLYLKINLGDDRRPYFLRNRHFSGIFLLPFIRYREIIVTGRLCPDLYYFIIDFIFPLIWTFIERSSATLKFMLNMAKIGSPPRNLIYLAGTDYRPTQCFSMLDYNPSRS